MDLADDSHRYALLGSCQRRPLAGEAGADYQYVMSWHGRGCYRAKSDPAVDLG